MFCTNCGKKIENYVIYCNYCGCKVENIGQETKENIGQETKEKVVDTDNSSTIDISKILKGLYFVLLIIGTSAALANIIKILIRKGDNVDIFGQVIFFLVFIVSITLLLKLKKIGYAILVSFALFKLISSIYYYKVHYGYLTKNLIIDEVFYLAIISLSIISWRYQK